MFKRFVFALLLVLMTLPTYAQEENDLEPLDFFLTFVPNIQFSPLYVTNELYMGDYGYQLEIQHGDENVGVDLIATGELPFGMIGGEQVLLARAGGRPVVFIYEWFQKYPVGVVVPDTVTFDLENVKVGIPGRFGASYTGFTALLNALGLRERDVTLEPIGFNAPDVVCTGGVDVSVIYVNNEPLQIQQRADAGNCGDISSVSVVYVADYVDMVSNGIVTNEDLIESNPELVAAMVSAYDAGLQHVINNPAEAYLISLNYVDTLPITDEFRAALEAAAEAQNAFLATNPDREAVAQSRADLLEALRAEFAPETLIQFEVLLATIELWDADQLGYTDPASWEATLAVLEEMGSLVGDVGDLSAAYTNDFLPEHDE
ncbi:MAG: ABC transporter substrate-binding protein [Phototrophicales bacterium]